MAVRELYIGSVGPFLYDDADIYDGTIEPHRGVWVPEGYVRAERMISDNPPAAPSEVLRLADLAGVVMNPSINDRTATRALNTAYQNTTPYWMIVMISADLEN